MIWPPGHIGRGFAPSPGSVALLPIIGTIGQARPPSRRPLSTQRQGLATTDRILDDPHGSSRSESMPTAPSAMCPLPGVASMRRCQWRSAETGFQAAGQRRQLEPLSEPLWELIHADHGYPGRPIGAPWVALRQANKHPVCGTSPAATRGRELPRPEMEPRRVRQEAWRDRSRAARLAAPRRGWRHRSPRDRRCQ